MSTTTLNNLWSYIVSLNLSQANKDWLAGKLLNSKAEFDGATEAVRTKMKQYCESHFDESFVREMEAQNYLIGSAQPTNEDEFRDIDEMFQLAEASGECTEQEVAKMFAL